MNDRVDVALAARADGVHIGPDDMTPEDARAILGLDAIIGVSIKSVAAAEAAPIGLVDYAGVGGVYTTLSKAQENPPIGTGRACAHCLRLAPPRAESPGRRYRRHRCRQCGCGDRRAPTVSPSSRRCRSRPIRPPRPACCAKWSTACWQSAALNSGSARTCESGDPVARRASRRSENEPLDFDLDPE